MRQSSIMNLPVFIDQRKHDMQKSPFPIRSSRIVSNNNNQENISSFTHHISTTPINNNKQMISNHNNEKPLTPPPNNCFTFSSLSQTGKIIKHHPNFQTMFNSNSQVQKLDLNDQIKQLNMKIEHLLKKQIKMNERIINLEQKSDQQSQCKQITANELKIIKSQIDKLKCRENLRDTQHEISTNKLKTQLLAEYDTNFLKHQQEIQKQITVLVKTLRKQQQQNRQKQNSSSRFQEISHFKTKIKSQLNKMENRLINQIDTKTKSIFTNLKKQLEGLLSLSTPMNMLSKTMTQYPLKPLIVKFNSSLKINLPMNLTVPQQGTIQQLLQKQQILYYVDREGYLLDKENYYLLDSKNKRIKLQQKHLDVINQWIKQLQNGDKYRQI